MRAKPRPELDGPSVAAASPAVKKRSALPLILAGAGGVLLLLVLGGGAAAYMIWGRSGPSGVVAEGESSNPDGPTEAAPSDPDGQPATESEPPGDTKDPGDKPGEAGGENPEPVDPADPAVGGPDAPAPDPDGGSGSEPEPEPEKPQPEPEPEKPAPPKPQPPKPTPPPKKVDPFKNFAKVVALPDLQNPDEPRHKVLGPVELPASTACYVDLLGAETACPKESDTFSIEFARNGLADRDWEISLKNSAGESVVAELSLKEDGLHFQWTDAAKDNAAAGFLQDCIINLRSGDYEHPIQLRQPQVVVGLPIQLDRPIVREKYALANAPRPEVIRVELTKIEGSAASFDPKQQLELAGDSTIAWLGEGEHVLGVRVDTAMQKDLQLTLTPYVTLAGSPPGKLNVKAVTAAAQQTFALSQQLNVAIQQMEKDKNRYKQKIEQAKSQLNLATQAVEQFEKLKTSYEAVSGAKAYVQFRVYIDADGKHIDLVQGTAAPAVEGAPGG
ncbi:MAG: hypothetical protein KDA41_22225 [Planctomycetales bacterium]|nr:hypothetical protein [Planctomycetales bacterium]